MARTTRSQDWGFPRWRGYGTASEAKPVRMCDRHGCDQPGDRPAPKSPNSPDRWYFCETHAGEYNRNWNYFEGLTAEEAAAREASERRTSAGFTESRHNGWAGPGDGSRSRDEMRALEALGLESDADFDTVKIAWRRLAKASHPDVKPGDADAAKRFQTVQAAYEVLRAAEERRQAVDGAS
ncbi:MAG: J domain-containing protein [Sphingomonas sp.]